MTLTIPLRDQVFWQRAVQIPAPSCVYSDDLIALPFYSAGICAPTYGSLSIQYQQNPFNHQSIDATTRQGQASLQKK